MSGLLWLATPGGTTLDSYDISPGLIGFAVTLAVAVAAILLLVNMTGKLRRIERRAEHDRLAELERLVEGAGDGGATAGEDTERGAAGSPTDGPGDDPAPRRADEV
jgi:hypothetical protein